MNRAVLSATAAILMAAAAAYAETTEVTTEKDGTFTVASNSRPGESTPAQETLKAIKVASAYCNERNLRFHLLSTKVKSSGVNRIASSRIYFECVAPQQ